MKSVKCPNCGLVSFQTQKTCKRCEFSISANASENNYGDNKNVQNLAFSLNNGFLAKTEIEDVKAGAWKKLKWGLMISIIGFALTSAAIYLGVFRGYENADQAYIDLAKLFSLITILPLSVVLAGIIELITGISILKIIEKWEELPPWLGWLIGIGAFVLVLSVILFAAAVVILNFL